MPPPLLAVSLVRSSILKDLVDTIAAHEGTSTTLGYVASALGGAVQGVVGIDPINAEKVAFHFANYGTYSFN